jgi:hypothetical protein
VVDTHHDEARTNFRNDEVLAWVEGYRREPEPRADVEYWHDPTPIIDDAFHHRGRRGQGRDCNRSNNLTDIPGAHGEPVRFQRKD